MRASNMMAFPCYLCFWTTRIISHILVPYPSCLYWRHWYVEFGGSDWVCLIQMEVIGGADIELLPLPPKEYVKYYCHLSMPAYYQTNTQQYCLKQSQIFDKYILRTICLLKLQAEIGRAVDNKLHNGGYERSWYEFEEHPFPDLSLTFLENLEWIAQVRLPDRCLTLYFIQWIQTRICKAVYP